MSGELAKVLAELRDEYATSPSVYQFMPSLARVEAAARADHPEDWPPRDGEVRNVTCRFDGGGIIAIEYEHAEHGKWIDGHLSVWPHGLAALKVVVAEELWR